MPYRTGVSPTIQSRYYPVNLGRTDIDRPLDQNCGACAGFWSDREHLGNDISLSM